MNFHDVKLDKISEYAKRWSSDVLKAKPFVLFLEGEMGTGKTTFTKALIEALGGNSVSSPTFTFLHEYTTREGTMAHLDLYRWNPQMRIEDLLGDQEYRGFIVEWPEAFEQYLEPTHRLTLHFAQDSDVRRLGFQSLADLKI